MFNSFANLLSYVFFLLLIRTCYPQIKYYLLQVSPMKMRYHIERSNVQTNDCWCEMKVSLGEY